MLNITDFKYSFLIEDDASLMYCEIKKVIYKATFDKMSRHIKYIVTILFFI